MLLKSIRERCSVRSFDTTCPVEDETIKNVLEAAHLAPSWVNVQPWHFLVVKDSNKKSMLGKLSNNQPHVKNAPVIIVCCGDTRAWQKDRFKKVVESRDDVTPEKAEMLVTSPVLNPSCLGDDITLIRTLEELTYAMAYMTLQAHEEGLGACVIGALGNELTRILPETYSETKRELKLPDGVDIFALLLLGYPDKNFVKPKKVRKPLEEIVSYETYGNAIK